MARRRRFASALSAAAFAVVAAPLLALPADAAIRVMGALGRGLLPLAPAARRIRDNLSLVRPDLDARAVAAGVGDNFGRVLAEYVRMADMAARPDRRRVTGLAHLTQAMAAGRGALIVSAHLGNWEAIRLAAADAGIPVGLMRRHFNNPDFDALALARVRMAGEPVLHKGANALRGMFGHLRSGGALLVLVDQRSTGGALVPFLGRPAETTVAVAGLAARLGTPVIPAVALREADGLSFDVRFAPPVAPGPPEAMFAEIHRSLDVWIDERPGQWFWLHNRWRLSDRAQGWIGMAAGGSDTATIAGAGPPS